MTVMQKAGLALASGRPFAVCFKFIQECAGFICVFCHHAHPIMGCCALLLILRWLALSRWLVSLRNTSLHSSTEGPVNRVFARLAFSGTVNAEMSSAARNALFETADARSDI